MHDQYRRSVSISVNLNALSRNLATARRLSPGSRLFATIKADAYGHGAVAVAQALSGALSGRTDTESSDVNNEVNYKDPEGIADGFAVVTVNEALELRTSGIEQPILVLQGPQSLDDCDQLRHHQLWPVIHDMQQYSWYRSHHACKNLSAWLKVDTGMGRLGVLPDQARSLLTSRDGVNWMGLMTHFACADEPDNPFTGQQIKSFRSVATPFNLQTSLANSAAVLAWPDARADWARPGVMLYGCNPLDRPLPPGVSLEPVMSVSAPVIAKKLLPAGAGVGYAQTWHCPEEMPVGYVALGYRDGLPRVLDTTASVSIEGQRCPIVGRVSMDSVAVDLRKVPHVTLGTAAEFWGETASIDDLAKAAGTINYELLTSIRGRRNYRSDA